MSERKNLIDEGEPGHNPFAEKRGRHASDSASDSGAHRSTRPRPAKLRHTQRGRFTVEGPSGTLYAFGSHGVLKVKGEDVEALLAINRVQRSCCGPRAPQVLYPLVLA